MKKTFLAFFIIAVAISVIVFISGFNIVDNMIKTEAVVTGFNGIPSLDGKIVSYEIYVEYFVDDISYAGFFNWGNKIEKGRTVKVYYDPTYNKPTAYGGYPQLLSSEREIFLGYGFMFLGSVLFMGSLIIASKKNKTKLTDKDG